MASIIPFPQSPIVSIARAEADWQNAVLSGDAGTLEQLLDEHYVFVDPSGDVTGKVHDLRVHRLGAFRMLRFDVLDSAIEVHGAAATVRLLVDLEGTFASAPFSGQFRYLRTWVRKGREWRLVAGSATLVPPPVDL